MAASLKAGHSWNQAMETMIREGSDPTAKEFGRVANEVRLGRPTDEALEPMAERLGSIDFEFVVMSVNIQRQVGGSLAELLDQVARDRPPAPAVPPQGEGADAPWAACRPTRWSPCRS